MLQIFSDAGHRPPISYASTLILKDWRTQVVFFCEEYSGLESCVVGEMMGIAQGLSWVLKHRPKERSVEVYTDNESVAQGLQTYISTRRPRCGAYPAVWSRLYRLCDQFWYISVSYVEAHQVRHDPNKACDVLCSALIRIHKAAHQGDLCTR